MVTMATKQKIWMGAVLIDQNTNEIMFVKRAICTLEFNLKFAEDDSFKFCLFNSLPPSVVC